MANKPASLRREAGLITVLDVGSESIRCVAGEVVDGVLRYRGHGVAEARGIRRGQIVELEKASAAITQAVERTEAMTECVIERASVGIGGSHIRGINSRGGIGLGARPREIDKEDVRAAVDRARSISLPPDRQILHLLPQEFILDEQPGIHDPVGMVGSRLEVNLHILTAATSSVQNLVTAANRAGIEVTDTVYEGLACADAVLNGDERELGVCLADIGAGSTELTAIYEGAVVHTAVIPIGGEHFTNDVAVGLRTPLAAAETIKRTYGCAVVTMVPEENEIEVPAVGDRPSRLMRQRLISEILEPRARELFEMMRENLRQAGVLEAQGAGMVLTGGVTKLPGIPDIAEQVLRMPTRIASPLALSKMPGELVEPGFATVTGMLLYAQRSTRMKVAQQHGFGARLRALFAAV